MILAEHDRWILFGAEVLVDWPAPARGRFLRPAAAGHVSILLDAEDDGERRAVTVPAEVVHLLYGPRTWIPSVDLDAPPASEDLDAVARRRAAREYAARKRR